MRVMSALVVGALIVCGSSVASAQTWQPPADSQRCPLKIQGGTGSTVAPIAIR